MCVCVSVSASSFSQKLWNCVNCFWLNLEKQPTTSFKSDWCCHTHSVLTENIVFYENYCQLIRISKGNWLVKPKYDIGFCGAGATATALSRILRSILKTFYWNDWMQTMYSILQRNKPTQPKEDFIELLSSNNHHQRHWHVLSRSIQSD